MTNRGLVSGQDLFTYLAQLLLVCDLAPASLAYNLQCTGEWAGGDKPQGQASLETVCRTSSITGFLSFQCTFFTGHFSAFSVLVAGRVQTAPKVE